MAVLSTCFLGCRKFIEIDPPFTSINGGNVYQADNTSIAAVIGIYTSMANSQFSGQLSFFPELSADNLTLMNLNEQFQRGYYQNDLKASDEATKPWILIYPKIYACNDAIEGLTASSSLTPAVKSHLLGQAHFLRAFFYFYLTNFYGDVPLVLSTDYVANSSLPKSPASSVYAQIIADLKIAESLLPERYLKGSMVSTYGAGEEEKILANRYSATALLARVYLYQKDWANAELAASRVIAKTDLYSLDIPLDQVFLKNSKETIWALQSVQAMVSTSEADFFTLQDGEPNPSAGRSNYLSEGFMRSFQTGDQRKKAWINTIITDGISYPYPAKYKAIPNNAVTEYSIFFRLAEQYLIRAEAKIEQNKTVDGIADLNVVRSRAIDQNERDQDLRLKLLSSSLSKEDALVALAYERRMELFSENAHRWFDLKRSGQINEVMTPVTRAKGSTWMPYKSLYPIPIEDITRNLSLKQNEGY